MSSVGITVLPLSREHVKMQTPRPYARTIESEYMGGRRKVHFHDLKFEKNWTCEGRDMTLNRSVTEYYTVLGKLFNLSQFSGLQNRTHHTYLIFLL